MVKKLKLINNFLKQTSIRKKYIKVFNIDLNYKTKNQLFRNHDNLITYILNISFSHSNTLLHFIATSGALIFTCSAGNLSYTGKNKRARFLVIKSMIRILFFKFRVLKNKPIALHLQNVGFAKVWLLKWLRIKFFFKVVKIFDNYPYNGCRKKKVRRKKY